MLAEHMTNAIRILGLDPGLRRTGWGVVALEGSRLFNEDLAPTRTAGGSRV